MKDLEVVQAAVLVREQAVDASERPVAPAPSVRRLQDAALLVGMQQLLERGAHDLFDGVPQESLDRRALKSTRLSASSTVIRSLEF